jgi:energy-coupling factor transport system permease protein
MASIVLTVTILSVPLWGIRWRNLLPRLVPMFIAVVMLALGNAIFTDRKGGAALIEIGPLLVTTESLAVGGIMAVRVAAIALPGILAVTTIDPVDLADALVQHLKVPARFTYGSLAALRLAPLMAHEWEVLGRARRARGLESGGRPIAAVRLFSGKAFALLVGAVRRATHLAVAMDARGFDSGRPRTAARLSRFAAADFALLAASAVVTVAAAGAGMWLGTWSPAISG